MEKDNDLISRSALIEAFRARKMTDAVPNYDRASSEVKAAIGRYAELTKALVFVAPAVDAEPVRHGRWNPVMHRDVFGKEFVYGHTCSKCNEYALCECANYDPEEVLSEYCPNCGAKMDAEVKDET